MDANLFYVDVSAGYWLHRDRCADVLTGIAGLVELHYTGALNDTGPLVGASAVALGGPQTFLLSNDMASIDVLNVTTAVHLELFRATSLRVGAVFPLTSGNDRFFDSEVSAQLIRRF